MAFTATSNKRTGLVRIRHHGVVDSCDMRNGRQAALRLAGPHHNKLLVDLRGAELKATTLEQFEFAQAEENRQGALARVAVVIDRNDPCKDQHQFIETVSVNRGAPLQVFDDERRALAWLNHTA